MGVDCNDGDAAVYQNLTGYPDTDLDIHYKDSSPDSVCSGSSLPSGYSASAGDDCNDSCQTCYPGSSSYTTSPDGLDQNCSGVVDENIAPAPKECGSGSPVSILASVVASACNTYCSLEGGSLSGPLPDMSDPEEGYKINYDFSTCSSGIYRDDAPAQVYTISGSTPIMCSCSPAYQ